MLLIYQGSTPVPPSDEWEALSDDRKQGVYRAYQEINGTPGVQPGLGLQPADSATTVTVADGKTLVTDGPFVGLKEAIGGYLIFEADHLDAAIELAGKVPAASMGGAVEIRPVAEW
jgi:hypothetical protein